MNLTSAPQIKALLAEYGLHPKKRLGQNFLIDRNVLLRIVDAAGVGPGDNVLEIGPGLGVVTRELAERGARVVCVEADASLLPILQRALPSEVGAEIVISDFLKVDLTELLGEGKWTVVGNLPYYITSPIIVKLLEHRSLVSSVLMMVQREVAQRLAASPATEEYGSLSVLVQFYCQVESVMRVSRNVFYPVPDVDSELVKLTVRDQPAADVPDEALFFSIVRAAFGKRRKTLSNALSSSADLAWGKERTLAILESAGIDGGRRGETLSIEEFAAISRCAGQAI